MKYESNDKRIQFNSIQLNWMVNESKERCHFLYVVSFSFVYFIVSSLFTGINIQTQLSAGQMHDDDEFVAVLFTMPPLNKPLE